ncbi:hypothetical protein F2P81_007498 [Scophthalmus maximus]|uniref:PiggyBac transposable element-derived protein domain-containing protein n=1 Tax=Scophthalmus maximus TaxID=52904 RepID=A0A6A4SZJ2_SCOMX|nr:hypothetical protein F2P81_007498 [Scophthalmus maximus]
MHVREVAGVTESRYLPAIDRHGARLPVVDAKLIKRLRDWDLQGNSEGETGGTLSWLVVISGYCAVAYGHFFVNKYILVTYKTSRTWAEWMFVLRIGPSSIDFMKTCYNPNVLQVHLHLVLKYFKTLFTDEYIANKPDKWGFKLFCRASSSGIIHDLLLYQGASTFINVALTEQEEELLLVAKLVTTLCKTIALPRLSVVFCDNYFTSFDLVQNLQENLGIRCMGGATLKTDKELMKEGRGAFDYMSAEGLLAVKWFDNKCVSLLSSACGITLLSSVKRWSKEAKAKVTVPCPSLIPAYNQHMGGIDLFDMLVHMYKTLAKSRRWYLPLFGYILDLCISNA